MIIEDITQSEIWQSQKDKDSVIPTYEEAQVVKFTEIESTMVVARGMGSYYWIGTEFQFGKMKTILEMDGSNDCTKMWLSFHANKPHT